MWWKVEVMGIGSLLFDTFGPQIQLKFVMSVCQERVDLDQSKASVEQGNARNITEPIHL